MNQQRKIELEKVAREIISQGRQSPVGLANSVAIQLAKQEKSLDPLNAFPNAELSGDDLRLFHEVVWDLIIDRFIVPEINFFDITKARFHVRSDAKNYTK